MSKGSGNGATRGDRRRNARRERLRELLPRDGAVVGIDLAEDKQALAVVDHDVRVLRPARPAADRLARGLADAPVQPGDGRQVRRADPGRRRRGGGGTCAPGPQKRRRRSRTGTARTAVGAAAILAETGDPRRYDSSSSLVKHAMVLGELGLSRLGDIPGLARKTVKVKAFRLGEALDWAVAQAKVKG